MRGHRSNLAKSAIFQLYKHIGESGHASELGQNSPGKLIFFENAHTYQHHLRGVYARSRSPTADVIWRRNFVARFDVGRVFLFLKD